MFFDKILALIHASDKIGFALLFAAVSVFAGQYYNLWPFTLLQHQLGYVLFAGLLGGGVLLVRLFEFLRTALRFSITYVRLWRYRRNAMDRIRELTPQQQAALLWIAHHSEANIYGSPLEEPFRALCDKGFLTRTDPTLFAQAFRVTRRIYFRKRKIRALFSKEIRTAIINGDPPWRRIHPRL